MAVHRLAGEGEDGDEQVVGGRPVVVLAAELLDEVAELLVCLDEHLGLEGVDLFDARGVPLDESLVARAEHLVEQRADEGDI